MCPARSMSWWPHEYLSDAPLGYLPSVGWTLKLRKAGRDIGSQVSGTKVEVFLTLYVYRFQLD